MICLSIQAISIAPWSRLVTTRVGWAGDLIKGVCDSPLMAGRRCRLSLSSEGRGISSTNCCFKLLEATINAACLQPRAQWITNTVDQQHACPPLLSTCGGKGALSRHSGTVAAHYAFFSCSSSAAVVFFASPPFEAERIIHILRPWTVLPLR